MYHYTSIYLQKIYLFRRIKGVPDGDMHEYNYIKHSHNAQATSVHRSQYDNVDNEQQTALQLETHGIDWIKDVQFRKSVKRM